MNVAPPFTTLLIASLAVWRLTHLLAAEDGPFNLVVRLRRLAGQSFWGRLLDCFYCLSLWVAAPTACLLSAVWLDRALLWLALSGAAILLERVTVRPSAPPPALLQEESRQPEVMEKETLSYGMLR